MIPQHSKSQRSDNAPVRSSSLQALDLFDNDPSRTQTGQVIRHRRWHSGPERLCKTSHERSPRRWQFMLCCIAVSSITIIFGKAIHDNNNIRGSNLPKTLSSILRFPCESVWRFFPTSDERCAELRPSNKPSGFSTDTPVFYLTRNTSQWKDSLQSLLPGMRHISRVSNRPSHVPAPDVPPGATEPDSQHPILLNIWALMRARDHIALHRGPQHALILDDSVLPRSAAHYVQSSDNRGDHVLPVLDQINQAVASLPSNWTILQLALTDATPLWAWDAIRSEWMLAGRPHVVAAPAAATELPYFGGSIAYVVHARGIKAILHRLGESYGALNWQQMLSRCPLDGQQSTLDCILYRASPGVFTATPPILAAAARQQLQQWHPQQQWHRQQQLTSAPAQNTLVWSRDSILATRARVLESRLFNSLQRNMKEMADHGSCSSSSGARQKLAGWVVYSAPDERLGEQLKGVLSSWLLSLLLCRKFAAVLWDGKQHAVDFVEVFAPRGNFGGPGLEIAESPPVAGAEGTEGQETEQLPRPLVYLEGKELSKLATKVKLEWNSRCCWNSGRHFRREVASLQRASRSQPIEVVTGCAFYRDLLPRILPSEDWQQLKQPATEAEFNTLGLLATLVLRPSTALTALMPAWTHKPLNVTERVVAVAVKRDRERESKRSVVQCGLRLRATSGAESSSRIQTRYVVIAAGSDQTMLLDGKMWPVN